MNSTLAERTQGALRGRYEVEREIGRGGMATVFLARDPRHDRPVAVKVLHPDLAAAIGTDRFLREVRITARLSHPHILPLLDSGEGEGLLYYVMPFVEGESLRARLDRQGALPVQEALTIAREVADALGFAHGRGCRDRQNWAGAGTGDLGDPGPGRRPGEWPGRDGDGQHRLSCHL